VALSEPEPAEAEITAAVWDPTLTVVTLNVVLVAPPGTRTEAGTVAAAWLLESVTIVPPEGAGEPKVTVPVELEPPTTPVGLSVNTVNDGGLIVSVAFVEADPTLAVIVADV
jgi:hypothetical protein